MRKIFAEDEDPGPDKRYFGFLVKLVAWFKKKKIGKGIFFKYEFFDIPFCFSG